MTNDEHERIVAELTRKYLILSVELEDLRALITAWADADDALVALFGTSAAWDTVNAAEKRSDEALDALRKAVGR